MQSNSSPFAVVFFFAKVSHKGVWKEEEDHLLKWNLRSDGWELVEGERRSTHPRGGGWWTRGGRGVLGGRGEFTKIPTHTSCCGWRGWRPPMLSDLTIWLIQTSKVLKLVPVFPQIFFFHLHSFNWNECTFKKKYICAMNYSSFLTVPVYSCSYLCFFLILCR